LFVLVCFHLNFPFRLH